MPFPTPRLMARTPFADYLFRWSEQLERLGARQLRRRLRVRTSTPAASGERGSVLNLASNDYLGLADDPRVVAAAHHALDRWGVGAGASRLVTGHTEAHAELEHALARFKGAEAALVFSSGYAANVGVLTALAGPRDVIFVDRLNHASLFDGARLTRATLRVYRHADLDHLEALLQKAPASGQRLVVTDGVFSMDGTLAPLPGLVELCARYEALLVVDDAHATGVVGPGGRGTPAHFGVDDHVPVRIGTLSKALGTQGGFVAGSQELIDLMVNQARAFIYSTGLAPAVAAAAREALRIAASEPARRERLHHHLHTLHDGLEAKGYTVVGVEPAPLRAVVLGEPDRALAEAERLEDVGILAPAIRPPTVPDGTARLRLAPRATHTDADIRRVLDALPPRDP